MSELAGRITKLKARRTSSRSELKEEEEGELAAMTGLHLWTTLRGVQLLWSCPSRSLGERKSEKGAVATTMAFMVGWRSHVVPCGLHKEPIAAQGAMFLLVDYTSM